MLFLCTRKNSPRRSGSLKGQLPKIFSEGVLLELFNVLYVDDGALTFEEQKQFTLDAQIIFDHLKRFGLEMNIRRGGNFSKAECVVFPPPWLSKKKRILPTLENGMLDKLVERLKTVRTKKEEKGIRTEIEYNRLAETRLIIGADCFISFCAQFKYLGSWLYFC